MHSNNILHLKGIYFIKNKINGLIYIGSTLKSFEVRFRAHVNLLRRDKHENPILQNAWNKYGENNFEFEVFESFDEINENQLYILEKMYIEMFNSYNRKHGYNICLVGKSRFGAKWSDESKLMRCGAGNPMYGKGDSRKGILNPMFGKKLSEKHKEKMSKSLKGLKKPITSIKLSKRVIQSDKDGNIIGEFKSATEVKNKLNISPYNCLTGRTKTAGGYYWKYKL